MSERILKALMQLFAILAKVDFSSSTSAEVELLEINEQRAVVEEFLKSELNSSLVEQYLKVFDEKFELLNKARIRKNGYVKKTSLNSVKVLRICAEINQELTRIQKKIVLIRILEFVHVNQYSSPQIKDFVDTVVDSFKMDKDIFELLRAFVYSDENIRIDDPRIIYVSAKNRKFDLAKSLELSNLDADIRVLRLEITGYFFVKYFGNDQLFLNGQQVSKDKVQIFSNGASLRTSKSPHLFYSNIVSTFLVDEIKEKVKMGVYNLSYKFARGEFGVRHTSFEAESGQLIGLMGSSGAGKSTLLNLLNGNIKPTTGKVTINGIDVHNEKANLEGKIGFISQDDLLIGELTVFENLYYNTKLCFKHHSNDEIFKRVIHVLKEVGLYEVKDLHVGNPLEQSISGGQRKRLNIALELIREPAVLFVDEPTSGLSSRDSENIMDLLKELSYKGKLLFVVIHQPSSDVYKMFDRLFVMDKGGYTIFDGNPGEALVHFKVHAKHTNADERECPQCGKVNPEELFNMIESEVVDEFGNLTNIRKRSPEEWSAIFLEKYVPTQNLPIERVEFEKSNDKPSSYDQYKVYLAREAKSKSSNRQYLLINFLEAPLLALFLAFFLKYFGHSNSNEAVYSFYHNENIPQYLFICVIVSLFLGLMVSAEEIIKDQLLLKRESFLNLSRSSYLFSKITILFIISATQSLLFVLVGNLILGIQGMYWEFWLVLFSSSCLANMVGLVISSTYNSVKVVYIFIPFIIIPQLLFSGVIVKYDKLNPLFTSESEVPWIGNLMSSRWAYEALAVSLVLNNPNEQRVFDQEVIKDESGWKRDYWMPELKKALNKIENETVSDNNSSVQLIKNEINKEQKKWNNFKCIDCLAEEDASPNVDVLKTREYLAKLSLYYSRQYEQSVKRIEEKKITFGNVDYTQNRLNYENESLERLVKNRNELNEIVVWNNELVQKKNPIYRNTTEMRFLDAPLYSAHKSIMGIQLSTFWSNIIVLWFFSIAAFAILYLNLGKKLVERFTVSK